MYNKLPGKAEFPFLFGGTFIEGMSPREARAVNAHFPSFSEGLSLRGISTFPLGLARTRDFPSFSEGLSLREGLQ